MDNRPKRRELFRGQLDIQYTRLANDGFGITPGGIPRFLRYLDATCLVGLAGSYDKSRRLKFLGLSVYDHVLELQLDAHDVDTVFAKKKRDPAELNQYVATVLTDIFAQTDRYWLAFDADRLAASLFLDYGIRVKRLIHLQSLKQSEDIFPSSFEAMFSLFKKGGFTSSEKDRQEIEDAFNDSCLEPKYYKRLSFRATSAYYMQKLWKSEVEDTIEMPALIDTTNLPEKALKVLGWASRTANLLDIRKPDSARNDFADATFSSDLKTVELELDRFSSRPRKQPSGSQIVVITAEDHQTKRKVQIEASIASVDGRRATLSINDPSKLGRMNNPKVISIMTIGKDEPSGAEDQLRDMILQRLLGRASEEISIEDVPLVELIWNPPTAATPAFILSSSSSRPTSKKLPPSSGAKVVTVRLNASQARAVVALCSPTAPSYKRPIVQIVQGPPGSGKTTMIAAMVQWLSKQSKDPIYLVTQSNTAVKNIAEKLESIDFCSYKIIVSREFKNDWHDHLYEKIESRVMDSGWEFPQTAQKMRERLGAHCQVILCTLSMLSTPKLRKCGLVDRIAPPVILIVDEASQVEISTYLVPFHSLRSLQRVCFVGDDRQLPPHGVGAVEGLKSIFEVEHLRREAFFLDTQYRMPVPIGEFLSREVYDGKLQSRHRINSADCVRLVDCERGEEVDRNFSWVNNEEIKAAVLCCRQLQGHKYCVITAYDAQRNEIEKALKEERLVWKDAVFNVDSFQGARGIQQQLKPRVTNVAQLQAMRQISSSYLSYERIESDFSMIEGECKKAMIVIAKREFLENKAKQTLLGLLAEEFQDRWMSYEDVVSGHSLFNDDDLAGNDIADDSVPPLWERVAQEASWSANRTRKDSGRDGCSIPSQRGDSHPVPSGWAEGAASWGDDGDGPSSSSGEPSNPRRRVSKQKVVGVPDGWGADAEAWSTKDESVAGSHHDEDWSSVPRRGVPKQKGVPDGWGVGADAWSTKDDESVAGSHQDEDWSSGPHRSVPKQKEVGVPDGWGVGAAAWSTKDGAGVAGSHRGGDWSSEPRRGVRKHKELGVSDGWGVGADAWSNKDDQSVAGSHQDENFETWNDQESGDNTTPKGGTSTPGSSGQTSNIFKPEQFDWADEPQENSTMMNTSVPTPNAVEDAGGDGWIKATKKKPLRRQGANGDPWGTRSRGRGRGQGRGRGTPPDAGPSSSSWRAQPSSSQPQQEELPQFNDVSEWMDSAWDTTVQPTWDAPS